MKQQHPIVSSMIVAEKRHMKTDVISAVANILGKLKNFCYNNYLETFNSFFDT